MSRASPNNQRPRARRNETSFRKRLTRERARSYGRPSRDGRGRRSPPRLLRDDIAGFPELGELEVLRHFTRLSQRNFAIESQFYPLGSCTMKYNPEGQRSGRASSRLRANSSVGARRDLLQGAMELLYELERVLAEISGMDGVSFAALRRRARRADRLDVDPRLSRETEAIRAKISSSRTRRTGPIRRARPCAATTWCRSPPMSAA